MKTLAQISIAHPFIGEEEKQAVLRVLESGQLAQGAVVAELEARFAEWCGVRHAVAVSSGTAALHVALMAHGIGPGDEVITSPMTFVASGNAALFVGARPVFVDVEDVTFCLDPAQVEAAITPRTKAIMPVHLYGHPAAMPELTAIARKHGLLLIEDACQAHGAIVHGKKVGALGDSATFSFYPSKNMTTGEGGLLTTNDGAVAALARKLRNHGQTETYTHEILGYNFRMTNLQAAIGLAQFDRLDGFNATRRKNAARLTAGLTGIRSLIPPTERPGYRHVYHQYTVRIPEGRARVEADLKAQGITTRVYYPLPVHQQPLYRKLGYGNVSLPAAERLSREVLSLPVHPALTSDELDRIIEAVGGEPTPR